MDATNLPPEISPELAEPPSQSGSEKNAVNNSQGSEPGRIASKDKPAKGKSSQADTTQSAAPRRRLRDLLVNPAKKPSKQRPQGFIYQVSTVFVVALLAATIFTTWTPGLTTPGSQPNLLPSSDIEQALQPSPSGSPGEPTALPVNPKLIGIVAGHWKHDSGAVCPDGTVKEVDINLSIANKVNVLLKKQGYEPTVLAEFDDRLSNFQAAALVSIHNDSCNYINDEASGFKVTSAMASREPEVSARLTACLRARYKQVTGMNMHPTSVTLDMSNYHAFDEINENTPAAIIETGFLNLDREILTQHQDVLAEGIVAGILCFLNNEDPILNTTP